MARLTPLLVALAPSGRSACHTLTRTLADVNGWCSNPTTQAELESGGAGVQILSPVQAGVASEPVAAQLMSQMSKPRQNCLAVSQLAGHARDTTNTLTGQALSIDPTAAGIYVAHATQTLG